MTVEDLDAVATPGNLHCRADRLGGIGGLALQRPEDSGRSENPETDVTKLSLITQGDEEEARRGLLIGLAQAKGENLQLPLAPDFSGIALSLAVQQQPDLMSQLLALQQQSQPQMQLQQQQQQQEEKEQTLPNEDMFSQLLGRGSF